MLDHKLARVRELLRKRDEIDAELDAMLNGADAPKRGRPRKGEGNGPSAETVSVGHSVAVSSGSSQSTGNGSEAE